MRKDFIILRSVATKDFRWPGVEIPSLKTVKVPLTAFNSIPTMQKLVAEGYLIVEESMPEEQAQQDEQKEKGKEKREEAKKTEAEQRVEESEDEEESEEDILRKLNLK